MNGIEILIALVVIAVIIGISRRANRPANTTRRPSWVVRAWNSSGARQIEGSTFGDAAAELTGWAAGGAVRGSKRAAGWTFRKTVVPAGHVGKRAAAWTARKTVVPLAKGTGNLAVRAGRRVTERAGSRWSERPTRPDRPLLLRRERRDAEKPRKAKHRPRRPWWKRSDKRGPRPDQDQRRPSRFRRWRRAPRPTEPDTSKPSTADARDEAPRAPEPYTGKLRLAPPPPASGGTVTTSDTSTHVPNPAAPAGSVVYPPPPDWQMMISRVGQFEPENDAALERFMVGEMAGMIAYAEALRNVHGTCVNSLGLDPVAVQGVADYAVAAGDAGAAMAGAHKRFRAVYEEIMKAVANGVVMPFKGRFFSGRAS